MVKPVMAVILAGGEGERLSILSSMRAKPAVPFGGKYRIIDFTLSNCVNSGIDDVVVLTQYNPRSLNDHIGLGRPWDLDRNRGGVKLLQPYIARGRVAEWYRGTADAVLQNLNVIEHDAGRHRPGPGRRPHLQDGLPAVRGRPPPAPRRRDDRRPARAAGRGDADGHPRPRRAATGSSSGRRSRSSPRATSPPWASTSSASGRCVAGCPRTATDFGANVIPAMLDGGARVFGYRFDGLLAGRRHDPVVLGGQHGPPRTTTRSWTCTTGTGSSTPGPRSARRPRSARPPRSTAA